MRTLCNIFILGTFINVTACTSIPIESPFNCAQEREPAAANICSQSFVRPRLYDRNLSFAEEQSLLDSFWKESGEITYEILREGKDAKLTFSTDTELPHSDVMRLLLREPELMLQFSKTLKPLKRANLIQLLGLTESQFTNFALRKGLPKDEPTYRLSDLNPSYFDSLYHLLGFSNLYEGKVLKIVTEAVKRVHNQLDTTVDGEYIELVHKSYETVPASFSALMQHIFKIHKNPQSHMHMGVRLPEERALAIAQAMETIVVIDLIVNDPTPTQELSFNNSTFHARSNRGPVYIKYHEFNDGVHDVELRQFTSLQQGFRTLAFGAAMVRDAGKIRLVKEKNFVTPRGTSDDYWGNVAGVLKHIANLISLSKDPSLQTLLPQLKNMSRKAQDLNEVTRQEVHDFIVKNNIPEILQLRLFLNP